MTPPEKDARDEGYTEGWFDALEGRAAQPIDGAARFLSASQKQAYSDGYELGHMTGVLRRRSLSSPAWRDEPDQIELERE